MATRRPSLRRFFKGGDGGVLVEIAAVMPLLVILLLGGFEAGRYFMLGQKLQRVVMTVADLAARSETLSTDDFDDIFAAAGEVARPFALDDGGVIRVSSVRRPPDAAPIVDWQRAHGTGSATSRLGTEGETASLADPALVKEGQGVIVAEISFRFEPLLIDLFPSQDLYAQASFAPRFSKTVALE